MKKFLLPESGNFYKANLHCHSTYSDGSLTPEELKKIYMEQGYSVIAYTDHDIMIPHHDLADDDFLPLTGFEVEINENKKEDFSKIKTCHICFIALDKENEIQPCWHRSAYQFANAQKYRDLVKFDDTLPDFVRSYTPECISDMMRIGREKGFFVTYNHPTWSMEEYPEYTSYNNMSAMEIVNYGCVAVGYDDRNSHQYDDMLRSGKRIYCIATDDNHNIRSDSFGGFTMIKADKLEYGAITEALVNGNFYASEGPVINSLWYEDGVVRITCEDAREIFITRGIRKAGNKTGDVEHPVTDACFKIADDDIYFRLTVVGFDGKCAYTNAYFVDELNK